MNCPYNVPARGALIFLGNHLTNRCYPKRLASETSSTQHRYDSPNLAGQACCRLSFWTDARGTPKLGSRTKQCEGGQTVERIFHIGLVVEGTTFEPPFKVLQALHKRLNLWSIQLRDVRIVENP